MILASVLSSPKTPYGPGHTSTFTPAPTAENPNPTPIDSMVYNAMLKTQYEANQKDPLFWLKPTDEMNAPAAVASKQKFMRYAMWAGGAALLAGGVFLLVRGDE